MARFAWASAPAYPHFPTREAYISSTNSDAMAGR